MRNFFFSFFNCQVCRGLLGPNVHGSAWRSVRTLHGGFPLPGRHRLSSPCHLPRHPHHQRLSEEETFMSAQDSAKLGFSTTMATLTEAD